MIQILSTPFCFLIGIELQPSRQYLQKYFGVSFNTDSDVTSNAGSGSKQAQVRYCSITDHLRYLILNLKVNRNIKIQPELMLLEIEKPFTISVIVLNLY